MLRHYFVNSIGFLLILAPFANAAIVTVPSSLSPGEQYRLAFVTSGEIAATSPNIFDYNNFAQNAANAVPALATLGISWNAVASTPSISARDNTNTNPIADGVGVPIFLLNDTKLADNNQDLWDGSIDLDFNWTETEATRVGGVWTGTDISGGQIANRTLGDTNFVFQGTVQQHGSNWISLVANDSFRELPLYVLSSPLTVVPEPSSLAAMLFGVAFLVGCRKHSRF